jgi:lipopolysaccharide transport system permease protein
MAETASSTSLPQEEQLRVRVMTPHSGLDAFRDAIDSLRGNFSQARQLAWRFFVRDTKADHRQSLLGYFWLVFPALANTLVWVFLNHQRVIQIDTGSVPYPLFVLSGVILWTAFNASLMAILNVVGSARAFLGKVNFPNEALVYSALLKALLDGFLAALMVIPALFLFADQFRAEVILFPIALLTSIAAGSALGLVMLPVAALYNDIGRGIQLILRFAFFLAPVIFALPGSGIARSIMLLNPATPIIATGRDWLTGSGEAMPAGFAIVLFASVILLSVGLIIYKVALPHLIERVGS